jgi:hypothetical protein
VALLDACESRQCGAGRVACEPAARSRGPVVPAPRTSGHAISFSSCYGHCPQHLISHGPRGRKREDRLEQRSLRSKQPKLSRRSRTSASNAMDLRKSRVPTGRACAGKRPLGRTRDWAARVHHSRRVRIDTIRKAGGVGAGRCDANWCRLPPAASLPTFALAEPLRPGPARVRN